MLVEEPRCSYFECITQITKILREWMFENGTEKQLFEAGPNTCAKKSTEWYQCSAGVEYHAHAQEAVRLPESRHQNNTTL